MPALPSLSQKSINHAMLLEDFNKIQSDAALNDFVIRYGLKELKNTGPASAVLGEWTGAVDGRAVYLKYRWFDPSGPFQSEPDVHVLRLILRTPSGDLLGEHEVRFGDV